MSSLNSVILKGGLTRDPELRHTQSGTAIAKFGLAISEKFKGKDGTDRENTCYVDIDAWGRLGENCAQYLRRGSEALVLGKLQFEQWEAKDGTKRSKLSVRATDVQFIGKAPSAVPNTTQTPPAAQSSSPDSKPELDPWEVDPDVPF